MDYVPIPIFSNSVSVERYYESQARKISGVSELVFVGDFSVQNGFLIFIEAIELLRSMDEFKALFETKSLHVTLIGQETLIDDENNFKSLEYVEMRSLNWKNRINLHIKKSTGFKDLLLYVNDQKRKKVVIMPSLVEGSNFLFLQMLRAGVPVIASSLSGMVDLCNTADVEIFFKAEKTELAQKLLTIFKKGGIFPIYFSDFAETKSEQVQY